MNKKHLICYYTDSNIYFYDLKMNKEIKGSINGVIFEGRIADLECFYKQIKDLLRKEKLILNLINVNITIITPSYYNKTDDYILINIFEKLEFSNIKLKKEKELITLKNNQSVIKIEDNYLIYYYRTKNHKVGYKFLPFSLLLKDKLNDILEYINKFNNNYHVTKNYLFGSSNIISNIVNELSKNFKAFIHEKSETYIFDKYIFENT